MSLMKSVNVVVRTLVISDLFFFLSLGLLTPIFAVFILENIDGHIEVIGTAVSIYWLARLVSTVPVSRLMDRIKGHRDEYYFLVFGTFMVSFVPLMLIFANTKLDLFLIQIFHGLVASMAVQSWRILFTSYIDKPVMGYEWSLEDVGICISTGLSASIGTFLVHTYGFNVLFYTMFSLSLLSTIILATLYRVKKIFKKPFFRTDNQSSPFKMDSVK